MALKPHAPRPIRGTGPASTFCLSASTKRFARTFFALALLLATSILASQGAVKIRLHGQAVCGDNGGVAAVTAGTSPHGEPATRIECTSRSAVWNDATAFDRALYRLVF
ncbi:MAG: hypothetical protein AAGG50_01190 [Bacteroidota bacterium]